MMGIDGKIVVEKFNDFDFGCLNMQIEDYLYGNDIWKPFKIKPEKMEHEEWELLDSKAKRD